MLIIHAGDSELVAVDCFECIDAQLDVREKLRICFACILGRFGSICLMRNRGSIYDSYAMRTFMHIDFNEQQ